MDIVDIFRGKAKHLSWARIPRDRVWNTSPSGELEPVEQGLAISADEAYFVVRLKEMYLVTARKLWRKLYPMLYGFVHSQGRDESAVAGPSQLRDLGEANLERMTNLNYRIAGPTAYKGGDLRVTVGLYAVPGADTARALVDTVGMIASIGGLALGKSVELASAIKTGVERIVGLDEAQLQLGIDNTFPGTEPLFTGSHVAIAAPAAEVNLKRLWLKDGRLVTGEDPMSAAPFEQADYFVLALERVDTYTDWPALPGMADVQRRFAGAMSCRTVDEQRARVRDVWPDFQQLIDESPYLVRPDRLRIAGNVLANLKARLARNDPFAPGIEVRSIAGEDDAEFDLVDVPEEIALEDAGSRALAERALARGADPFGG